MTDWRDTVTPAGWDWPRHNAARGALTLVTDAMTRRYRQAFPRIYWTIDTRLKLVREHAPKGSIPASATVLNEVPADILESAAKAARDFYLGDSE